MAWTRGQFFSLGLGHLAKFWKLIDLISTGARTVWFPITPTNFQMDTYLNKKLLFGDMHNHCGISYAHGSLEDALRNARERLDFVSITGHAHWPDMPEPNEDIQYIIDFHEEGFTKLKKVWPKMMETLKQFDEEGHFVVFPGFEVHYCSDGDRNMLYKDLEGEILYPKDLDSLHDHLRVLREKGKDSIAQPHHVGYLKGTRGIDWNTFNPEFAPFVEMLSMHGCSESSENIKPFLHSMGPSDWESTIHYGLKQGHVFGFSGGTDHHSAHPGSYGHGMTGLWADSGNRADVWNALYERRMFALTGDKMDMRFCVNDAAMGSMIEACDTRKIEFDLKAGGPIDCVDVLRDGELVKRFSQYEMNRADEAGDALIHTKIYLELGWGARHRSCQWEAELGLSDGEIKTVEPRFRGHEVVSPVEADDIGSYHTSKVLEKSEQSVRFQTVTSGNPNNSTNMSQGMCIEVLMPRKATVWANLNGKRVEWTLGSLMEGARSGVMKDIDSPAWRFNRAPEPREWKWSGQWEETDSTGSNYYLRVRQRNDQWGWSSPVFLKG